MQSTLMLTIGMVLIACAGEYLRPGTMFLQAAHIAFQPVYAYIAGIAGACLIMHHQRQSDPVKE